MTGDAFVSRGGMKLRAALERFALDPSGLVCADLGANVGGFTDCLLQNGAARVYSVDTGYGTLAWTLRNDGRVTVLERTNAMHFDPATIEGFEGCGLVCIDLGWTRQRHALPTASRWLARGGRVVTLIKPHYESETRGVLSDDDGRAVAERVIGAVPAQGFEVIDWFRSPVRGGGSRNKSSERGNAEYLALLRAV